MSIVPRFVVDEAGFRGLSKATLEEGFERLVERLQLCGTDRVALCSGVWSEIIDGRPLTTWLFEPGLLDREVANALASALTRLPNWDETVQVPTTVALSVAGSPHRSASVAMAAEQTFGGRAVGCVSAGSHCGSLSVQSPNGKTDIVFVGSKEDVLAFFRAIPEIENLDEAAYFANASDAFPGLHFVLEKTSFKKFEEDYPTVRVKVTHHLSVLNDHARNVIGNATATKELRARGVDASPENGNTKGDRAAMRERTVLVGTREVVCGWHTKIRPHRDRIYFNATDLPFVVVGVFHAHLT